MLGDVLGRVLKVANEQDVDSAHGVVYVLGAVHGTAPTQNARRSDRAKGESTQSSCSVFPKRNQETD